MIRKLAGLGAVLALGAMMLGTSLTGAVLRGPAPDSPASVGRMPPS